jgi:two-component system KDP operon response regulator KdpE
VSERDEPSHRVALLDAGADDVVTRPFDPEELLARIRAVARRVARLEEERPIVTPDFTMHIADRRFVRADGGEVTMSPTEWRLIEVLVHHAGHLVTREELLVSVWGPQAATKTQYLRVHMASIRQKAEPDPSRPRYFVTIPGLGLRFEADGGTASGETARLTPTG